MHAGKPHMLKFLSKIPGGYHGFKNRDVDAGNRLLLEFVGTINSRYAECMVLILRKMGLKKP